MTNDEPTTITTHELTEVTGAGATRDLAEKYGYDYDALKGSLGPKIAKISIQAQLGGLRK
ncbi:MAG TPA: hypothetical protein VH143_07485 [Kofleriaceae bacterium]|nr:hypothetical protein [Kofleriaceae bacterium]